MFEEEFREAKMLAAERRAAEIKNEHTGREGASTFSDARKTTRLNRNQVLERLWHPKAPALCLMGVKIGVDEAAELDIGGEGTFVSGDGFINSANPSDFMKAFAHLWGRVFGPNNTDVEVAGRLIEEYLEYVKWDWALLQTPTLALVQYVMSKLKSTAPGLDGIPNMAWTFGGEYLAQYILDLIDAFCSDEVLPADINWSMMAFLDKSGEAPEHAQAPGMIFRHPLDTRPLSLKQADNKLVAGVLNFCISPAIAHGAIDIQTGFIHGRILIQNVVDLDFHARMQAFDFFSERKKMQMIHISSKGMVNSLPFLLLWDFASAFPSVAHAWLFSVLDAIKLWRGFVTGIRNLYSGNKAYGQSGGVMVFMFMIVSGVLQGCPLSGTLFVLVIDPLLWSFKKKLSSTVIRTCADDIGMALRRLDELCLIAKIFYDFECASNLKLKPKKSILIPTVFKLSNWNLDMVRAWLRRAVPHWENLIIRDSAKYLGFFMGPTSGTHQWAAAFRKYSERVVAIKHLKLPLRLAVSRHNYWAVPVLGYISQLALPPHVLLDLNCLPSYKLLDLLATP